MRKIESQMCAAISANKNWKSGNTEVVTMDGVSFVYLHGNKIAMVDDTTMTIFDGGWQSNTTKSRLNALCTEFCIAGEGVFQKDFLWYVRKFVGAINGQNVYKTEDFVSGYLFAWFSFRPYLTLTCKRLNSFFTVNSIVQMVGLWTTVWVTLKRQKRMRLLHVIDSILTLLFHTLRLKIDQN